MIISAKAGLSSRRARHARLTDPANAATRSDAELVVVRIALKMKRPRLCQKT
jgi:hypothetical protein